MGHFAGRTAQLAEVMDIWLHLRKWAGLDLLRGMHSSLHSHSSWKKGEANVFKRKLRMGITYLATWSNVYWSAFFVCVVLSSDLTSRLRVH